jgi:hypothetical protein
MSQWGKSRWAGGRYQGRAAYRFAEYQAPPFLEICGGTAERRRETTPVAAAVLGADRRTAQAPASQPAVKKAQINVHESAQLQLPVAHIDPLLELAAYSFEVGHLFESQGRMQADAGRVGLGDPAQHYLDPPRA